MGWDVLVIGGGPAGLSAAINVRARGRSVLTVSNPPEENPLWRSARVDNYPGLPGATGAELLTAMRRHAEGAGAEFLTGKALSAALSAGRWYVSVGSDVYDAGAVVLAAGAVRDAKLPGEAELLGRGVSYCATCDGMLYRGKKVCVVGFTSDAAEEAELLRTIGCEVEQFTTRTAKYAVLGEERVRALSVNGEEHACEAVFILRPVAAPDTLLSGLAMDGVHVAVDKATMKTSVEGVFAAGDCTGKPYQIAKAVGDGNIAALSAAQYIEERNRETKA